MLSESIADLSGDPLQSFPVLLPEVTAFTPPQHAHGAVIQHQSGQDGGQVGGGVGPFNAWSKVPRASSITVANRACLLGKCRYSADAPTATASATSLIETLPYPLSENRVAAASMINWRRFPGRVPWRVDSTGIAAHYPLSTVHGAPIAFAQLTFEDLTRAGNG